MKRGQVWIETVIYTLIGLSLIGVVLAIMTPRINEFRDRTIIDQTIESLNVIDAKVSEVLSAPGNKRKIEFRMKRGDLYFYPDKDQIKFTLEEARVLYSQPGTNISIGRITALTEEGAKRHTVTLTLDYSHNLTFDNQDSGEHKFSGASVPFSFTIENKGFSDIGKAQIDIAEVS